MPISTEDGGAGLVGRGQGSGTRTVEIIKQSYVASIGRNSAVGEVVDVSDSDARFMLAYRYAKRPDKSKEVVAAPAVVEVVESVEVESTNEASVENDASEEATEVVESEANAPQRVFRRGRRRNSESE